MVALIESFLSDGSLRTTNFWNVSITSADQGKDIFVYDWLGLVSSSTTTLQQKNYWGFRVDDRVFSAGKEEM